MRRKLAKTESDPVVLIRKHDPIALAGQARVGGFHQHRPAFENLAAARQRVVFEPGRSEEHTAELQSH